MAVFANRSWQFIEKLEICCGLWSDQNRFHKYAIRSIIVLFPTTVVIPAALRLRRELGVNLVIAAENVGLIMMFAAMFMKLIMCSIYDKKRRTIYEKVNNHFKTIAEAEEAFVLTKFSENAKKFCFKYTSSYCAAGSIFYFLPMAKIVYESLINNSEFEKIYPFYVDYSFIDEDKYYPLTMISIYCTCYLFIIIHSVHDVPFIMTVRHVCALFEVVKIRLREASGFLDEFEWDMMDFITADSKAYERITQAIDLHNVAIEMAALIEEVYNMCWFAVLTGNAFIFSGGVYVVLQNSQDPFNLLRYFSVFLALLIHFSVQFYHGQMLIDSSSSVSDACYNVKWYVASKNTRKLLSITMFQSIEPCVLTGGRLYDLSMETYCKMVKVGFSYFSVFNR